MYNLYMDYVFMFIGGPKDGHSFEANYIPSEITVGDHLYVMEDGQLVYKP